jgi:hypothetical protein
LKASCSFYVPRKRRAEGHEVKEIQMIFPFHSSSISLFTKLVGHQLLMPDRIHGSFTPVDSPQQYQKNSQAWFTASPQVINNIITHQGSITEMATNILRFMRTK